MMTTRRITARGEEGTVNDQVPDEVKRGLLSGKLQLWRNTLYDAQLDIEVAKAIEDERLMQQSATRLKGALKAIDLLEKMLADA